MKKKGYEIFIWVVTVIFIGAIFFFPERVPVHWNSDWQIDEYGSRYTLLILAFLPILAYYGMMLTKKIDPKKGNFQSREKTYDIVRNLLSFMMILLSGFFYYLTVNPNVDGSIGISILLGCLLIGLGNYMPKVPANFFVGIKTPWTLSNDIVWAKTHRLGGYGFVLFGVLMIITGLFKVSHMSWVIVIGVVLTVVFPMIYSYVIYKKLEKNQ